MIDAAEMMPAEQGMEFVMALLRYGRTGEEPEGRPMWLPTFVVCKGRIDMSGAKHDKARRMASARYAKMHDEPQAGCTDASKQDARDHASKMHDEPQAGCTDASKQDAENENENENENEITPPTPPSGGSAGGDPRADEATERVIAHLNDVCGTSYRPRSAKSRQLVGARLREGFSAEDCERVIDNMAARWLGDERMRRYLRPETLFNATKFEGYLNAGPPRASPAEAIAASLAAYDEGAIEWVPVEDGGGDVQRA